MLLAWWAWNVMVGVAGGAAGYWVCMLLPREQLVGFSLWECMGIGLAIGIARIRATGERSTLAGGRRWSR